MELSYKVEWRDAMNMQREKVYRSIQEAEQAKKWLESRGATEVELRVQVAMPRKSEENE